MTAITVTDLDNAKLDVDHISEIANSMDIVATDRLGHVKDTISGAIYKITAFTNRGAWAPTTAYAVKDLVSNGGSWYVAVVAHTSSAAFATDTASKWRLYQGVTTGDLSAASGAALVGVDHKTVYDVLKNGRIDLSEVAAPAGLTAAINASAGNLNGATVYVVTYVTSYGETICSPQSNSVSPANQKVDVTIPVSANTDVTGRRIYRTAAGAVDTVLCQLVATVNDNTTTVYTDNIADGSLGVSVPRIGTAGGGIWRNGVRLAQSSGTTTVFGENSSPNNSGYANTAFGSNTLTANTSGYRNCAYGIFSLYLNTTGARNSAYGVHSLNNNTTGNDSTAFGYAALISSTASSNTAVGSLSLEGTTTGGNNTAVGSTAAQLNTTGSNNTAVGHQSLYACSTGILNTAIGAQSLKATTGNFGTAIGFSACANNTGSGNTAIGAYSLADGATAESCVAIGFGAGRYETGINKLFISNGSYASEAEGRSKSLIYGVFGSGPGDQSLQINGAVGFNGRAPQVASAVNGAATDLATALTLLNQIRAVLIANGLCS